MDLIGIIAPPVIGGLIGYGTNYIAIKMLFRPRNPIMLGRFRVPFTPGIVPKRKDMLAGILGKAIVEQFFNSDDLEAVFSSESFANAVADGVVSILKNPGTKLSFLSSEGASASVPLRNLKDELCVRLQAAILKSDLKKLISEQGGSIIMEKAGNSKVARLLGENLIPSIAGPLAAQIERHVLENGRSFIMPLIEEELRELSNEPVSNIAGAVFPDEESLRAMICSVHSRFMKGQVRKIAGSIDIGKTIADKVRLMDAGDVERLVLSVVKRELHYVVLLGSLIGAIIGTVNIFV